MKHASRPLWAVLALFALLGAEALAEPVWLCAITHATAVRDDGTSGAPDLGGLARPTFLRVDVAARKVTILAPAERRGETTEILTVQQEGSDWLLAGVERGRPWSMLISADGHLTFSVLGDGEVWSVFGHALPAEK